MRFLDVHDPKHLPFLVSNQIILKLVIPSLVKQEHYKETVEVIIVKITVPSKHLVATTVFYK